MARSIDILVLSDLHLGTNQCRVGRLYKYLKSVKPKMLILKMTKNRPNFVVEKIFQKLCTNIETM